MTCLSGNISLKSSMENVLSWDGNWITNDTVQLYTNASGAYGYGAVCGQSWFFLVNGMLNGYQKISH